MNPSTEKIISLLQEKVRLDPLHRRIFYAVFAVLWLSGALWVIVEWTKNPDLGPVRTPLQTLSIQIHAGAMFAYIVMLGSLLTHVRRGLALGTNRLSGWILIAINAVLLISGWLLYYTSNDLWREWSSFTHWTVGTSAIVLLVGHILLGRVCSAKTPARHPDEEPRRMLDKNARPQSRRKEYRRNCA